MTVLSVSVALRTSTDVVLSDATQRARALCVLAVRGRTTLADMPRR